MQVYAHMSMSPAGVWHYWKIDRYIRLDGANVGVCQNGGPSKNVNPMALSTSGPNLVLLDESEPNSLFIDLHIYD